MSEFNQYDVMRLGLILAVQAEIDGMKADNSQRPNDQRFTLADFEAKAKRLTDIVYSHNEQLF